MADCPHIPEETYSRFSMGLHGKGYSNRVPIVGSMELTQRCNLLCVHCYCDDPRPGEELGTREFKDIIDQISDSGCLWLLLTGGECLLRSDFEEIYLYIKQKGIFPTIFTNGTLVTPELAGLLAEWRPFSVEVTIYGATRETYEKVTGVRGSFDRCLEGIEFLVKYGLKPKLKTMVMKENVHELEAMYAIADSMDLDFRHDPLLNPTLSGSLGPTAHRIDPEMVVELDRIHNADIDTWREFFERSKDIPPAETLVSCCSGLYAFHIDPRGRLYLCLMARDQSYDLVKGGFEEGWRNYLGELRQRPPSVSYRCGSCNLRHLCGSCFAWAGLETGDPEGSVDYLCHVAALRARAFGNPEIKNTGENILKSLDEISAETA